MVSIPDGKLLVFRGRVQGLK